MNGRQMQQGDNDDTLLLDPEGTHSDRRNVPAIDAHIHCFAGADDPRFPVHPRAPYRPERAASPEHLLGCMDGSGVDFGVIVHPEFYQDDHRYLEHCLEVGAGRLKGTCLFFADRPDSRDRMTELVAAHPGRIVAARIHAYAPERLPPFGKKPLFSLWSRAVELGLAIQLHFEPRYAHRFEPLIREFPRATVIVDHLGRPMQGSPDEYAVVLKWAALPNVAVKLSLLPRRDDYPHRDVSPILTALLSRFGPDRLLYGGNYDGGSTPGSFVATRERLLSYFPDLSPRDRAKILGGTAARLFGFPDLPVA